MSSITRMWMGFAAVCAGIIHLALVVSSPPPVAVLLGAVGVAECGWGVLTFIRDSVAAPRVVLFAFLGPTVLWGVLVAAATAAEAPAIASYLGFAAMMSATVFELFIAGVVAVHLRRGGDFTASRQVSAPRYLLGVVVGGVLAAMLVTPALSATDAGRYARPMGDMPGMDMGEPALVIHGR